MVDVEHCHPPPVVADLVEHPVVTAACGPHAVELVGQGLADPAGCVQEVPSEQLQNSHRDVDGQTDGVPGQPAARGALDRELVTTKSLSVPHNRPRARIASTNSSSVTVSISSRAARTRATVSGSDSTSSVSSSDSKSSVLIKTAAGRPLRVIVTRS